MNEQEPLKTIEEQQLDYKVEQVRTGVKAQFEAMDTNAPFDELLDADIEIYKRPDFQKRTELAGMKLYLGMLDNGGTLPGKQDCFIAGRKYVNGMTDRTAALFYMCIYEACCIASSEYMMRGKMNEKLSRAAVSVQG